MSSLAWKIGKVLVIAGASCAGLLIAAFLFLLWDVGGDKDKLLQTAPSPDGGYTAQLHENITPGGITDGGPDTAYVVLSHGRDSGRVFTTGIDCSSHDPTIEWIAARALRIRYTKCNGADAAADRIGLSQWMDIELHYEPEHP